LRSFGYGYTIIFYRILLLVRCLILYVHILGDPWNAVTNCKALITLAVLGAAIACFIGGWLAPELVALVAAGLLIATRVLSPTDALAGFGSPALITLMGLFVLAQALLHSGALDRLRELLASPHIRTPPPQLIALLALVVAPLSGLIPNTPIVAILLPVIQSWCQRRRISPSRVLLPLSFATIIGGTLTLIGTSTNLLASDLAVGLGYGSFQTLVLHRHRYPRVAARQRLSTAEQPLAARSRPGRWRQPGRPKPPGLLHRGAAPASLTTGRVQPPRQPPAAPLRC
jgi:di/tricarboxylate transporter